MLGLHKVCVGGRYSYCYRYYMCAIIDVSSNSRRESRGWSGQVRPQRVLKYFELWL